MIHMTKLNRWFYMKNDGDDYETYTQDSWLIPEEGTEVWCTRWGRGQTIKPYGDGCHVIVGISVYHCDEFMEILKKLEQEGETWGIVGVTPIRKQHISGKWVELDIKPD